MIDDVFQLRRQAYHKRLLKYARLIFNDHFILVLFLIFGAGGHVYSQYLQNIESNRLSATLTIGFISVLVTQIGSLAIFFDYADRVYLLPQEMAIKQTLKKSFWRSLSIQSLCVLFAVGFISPLLQAIYQYSLSDLFIFLLILMGLKVLNLIGQINQLLYSERKIMSLHIVQFFSVLVVAMIIGQYQMIAFLLTFIFLAAFLWQIYRLIDDVQVRMDWSAAISHENARVGRIYQMISLFTDVPGIRTDIRHVIFLDRMLTKKSQSDRSPEYFYLLRVFIRDSHYLDLWLRLTVIAAILIHFSEIYYISGLVGLLFSLLTAYQLFFQIYPLSKDSLVKPFKKVIYQLLSCQWMVFQLLLFIHFGLKSFLFLLIFAVFLFLFVHVYITKWLQKEIIQEKN